MKILIFRSGAIGDVLMTTPLVRAVRNRYPQAEITYLTGNWSKEAIRGNCNIDNLITFDDSIIFRKKIWKLINLVRKVRKEKFDLAFVLDKSKWFGLLVRLAQVKDRIGFDREGEGKYNTKSVSFDASRHEIDYYLDIGKMAGAKPVGRGMELQIPREDVLYVKQFLKNNKIRGKIVGIAAGGASNPGQELLEKRWPWEKYKQLCEKMIAELGCTIVLFGGEGDMDISRSIKEGNDRIIDVTGSMTIKQSAALMSKCDLFVTHDSGPMHMAAASGTKVIALFGPTDPRRFLPEGALLIQSSASRLNESRVGTYVPGNDSMNKISVEKVLKEAMNTLK